MFLEKNPDRIEDNEHAAEQMDTNFIDLFSGIIRSYWTDDVSAGRLDSGNLGDDIASPRWPGGQRSDLLSHKGKCHEPSQFG